MEPVSKFAIAFPPETPNILELASIMGSTCSSTEGSDDVKIPTEPITEPPVTASNGSESATKYKPAVIVGPSGVGKGTLLSALKAQFPESLSVAVSHTTRQPRQGEKDGVHYHFVSKEQFQKDIEDGKFIEHAGNYGNFYGTSKQAVQDVAEQQQICLLEIDYVGAKLVKESNIEANYLFITVKGEAESCKKRMESRGTENAEQVEKRVRTSLTEFQFFRESSGFFDASISNDDLAQSTDEIIALFQKWYKWLPSPINQASL